MSINAMYHSNDTVNVFLFSAHVTPARLHRERRERNRILRQFVLATSLRSGASAGQNERREYGCNSHEPSSSLWGDVSCRANYLDCLCSVQVFTLPSSLLLDVA